MKVLLSLASVMLLTLSACAPQRQPVPPGTIPIQTQHSRSDEAYGQAVLAELSKQFPVDHSRANNQRVRSIVDRLARAAKADRYPWYVYVLRGDNVLNAAATRGNHVFVWTGMLKLARQDDELAAVIGHEIAHVLAGHTQPTAMEQVSQILVGMAGQATNAATGPRAGGIGGQLASTLAQAVLVNPGSQRLELEADHVGLFMMARAGYDPQAAIALWERMEQVQGGTSDSLAFLSTHPPSQERLQKFEDLLPEARRAFFKARPQPELTASDSSNKIRSTKYENNSRKVDNIQTRVLAARVVPASVIVLDRPDIMAQPRSILYRSDRVRIIKELKDWVEIDRPVAGFLQKRVLRPE